jgi:hypothetical protein
VQGENVLMLWRVAETHAASGGAGCPSTGAMTCQSTLVPAVLKSPLSPESVEDQDYGNLTLNHFSVDSFQQTSIGVTINHDSSCEHPAPAGCESAQPTPMVLLAPTRGTRELISIPTISGL